MSSASASRRDGIITDINATQSATSKQPVGGISNNDIPNISALVNSLQADIKHIKNQLQNLPPFPQGSHHYFINISLCV
jgi:monomeric isocitrate dehydrogenase